SHCGVFDQHLTGETGIQTAHGAQERGLSGTRGPDDRNNFTGGNCQVDVRQNLSGGAVGAKGTPNMLASHGRWQYSMWHRRSTPSTLCGSTCRKVVAATSTSQVS